MKSSFENIIPAAPQRWQWTGEYKKRRLKDVLTVVNRLRDYWPLTVRVVYYRVTSIPGFRSAWWWHSIKGPTKGRPLADYPGTIGEIIKWARIYGNISWSAINDEGRLVSGKVGFSSTRQFFRQQIDQIFNGYSACLAQNQERYIEVWVESNGLYHIVKPVVDHFCRITVSCKGYQSVTLLHNYALRAKGKNNPTILYFGDLNPAGIEIPKTFMSSLINEHGLEDINIIRCGLNRNQTENLQADPAPIKGKKSIRERFIAEHGGLAYELDAVDPPELQRLVYDSLAAYTDMEVLQADMAAGDRDRQRFDELQRSVEQFAEYEAADMGLIL